MLAHGIASLLGLLLADRVVDPFAPCCTRWSMRQ